MGAPAAASELIAPGTQLGKYRVIHRIAYGGMAEIYLARASGIQGFEKYVVLKRILPQFAENVELIRMFLQEARLAAMLDHANIAQVHDIGEDAGLFFFTMEYLHGEDVRRIVKHLNESGGGMPLEHAIHVVIDAAAGLHFAHEKKGADGQSLGIVHRDLSPANLVVTYAGGVKVVDFGVAKIANRDLSGQSSLKGKIAYMSPEQITHAAIDRRSDVYALGIVLYELTTRKRLYKGANEVEAIQRVVEANVAPPTSIWPEYPPELERIVMRALQRAPENRYQSARDLQLDLEAFARDRKLEISSAALAEWMEKTFGPKREIWHTVPLLEDSNSGKAAENSAATRKVSDAELARLPAHLGVRPRSARPRALVATLATLLVLSIGGGALAWRHHLTTPTPAAGSGAGNGAVLVVAENGNVAIEQAPSAPSPPSVPAAATAEQGASSARAHAHGHARAGRAQHAANGPEALSSALAKRQGEIRRCFTELDDHGAGAGEVALRFEIGVDGTVTSVAVLPATIGATPLGACLTKVGRATSFAPQPSPISFRIPLSVQLRRQEHGP